MSYDKIKEKNTGFNVEKHAIVLIGVVAILLIFNQYQISGINGHFSKSFSSLEVSDIYEIKSTSQAVAVLFPVQEISNDQDAINMMISQGTPDYGKAMGVSYDDPAGGVSLLGNSYQAVKKDVKQNYPDVWNRYLNLATKPVGISCEFCCGVGPTGITKSGDLKCGCKHNLAAQALTMLLMKDTDYNDAEVLKEVLKWKALYFPKPMVELAIKASGGDGNADSLPGMVGGC